MFIAVELQSELIVEGRSRLVKRGDASTKLEADYQREGERDLKFEQLCSILN